MGVFDNAKTVEINGKTVKSIIKKDDGGVIYGGESPSSKIATKIVVQPQGHGILLDINDNYIPNVTVRYMTIYDEEKTIRTAIDGQISIIFDMMKWVVFDGNDTYEGCRWDR